MLPAHSPTLLERVPVYSDTLLARIIPAAEQMSSNSANLLEDVVGGLERVQASGNPAVDRRVNEHFLDLVDGHSVVEGTAHVQLDLGRAIERGQHRQIDEAACLAIEPWTRSRVSPSPLGRQALKSHREIVGGRQRLVDVVRAEHLAAQCESAFEKLGDRFVSVVGHGYSLRKKDDTEDTEDTVDT